MRVQSAQYCTSIETTRDVTHMGGGATWRHLFGFYGCIERSVLALGLSARNVCFLTFDSNKQSFSREHYIDFIYLAYWIIVCTERLFSLTPRSLTLTRACVLDLPVESGVIYVRSYMSMVEALHRLRHFVAASMHIFHIVWNLCPLFLRTFINFYSIRRLYCKVFFCYLGCCIIGLECTAAFFWDLFVGLFALIVPFVYIVFVFTKIH